jgi:hypothetical protein
VVLVGSQQSDEQQILDSEWVVLIEQARNMRISIEEVRQFIHNGQIDKVMNAQTGAILG